jgi:hypothetical protein
LAGEHVSRGTVAGIGDGVPKPLRQKRMFNTFFLDECVEFAVTTNSPSR